MWKAEEEIAKIKTQSFEVGRNLRAYLVLKKTVFKHKVGI